VGETDLCLVHEAEREPGDKEGSVGDVCVVDKLGAEELGEDGTIGGEPGQLDTGVVGDVEDLRTLNSLANSFEAGRTTSVVEPRRTLAIECGMAD
jgi:hypothetical protein